MKPGDDALPVARYIDAPALHWIGSPRKHHILRATQTALLRKCLMNPFRRIRLHFSKHVRHGHGGVNAGQQMNMVGCAAGGEQLPVLVLEDAAHIVVEALLHVWSDLGYSVLGAENQMVTQACKRVPQRSTPAHLPPRRGSAAIERSLPGADAPGYRP